MEKNIFSLRIADLTIEVHSLYEKCRLMCGEYVLDPAASAAEKPDIIVDIVPRNIKRVNDLFQKQEVREGNGTYLYYDPGYMEYYAVQRKISEAMPMHGGMLMHGAVVADSGYAYMFTAPSGVGKSTRASLWLKTYPDAYIINGDKPFIRLKGDSVIAYGSPWCGKERWNTNVGVPLRAIFLLERSSGLEMGSQIQKITIAEAYVALLNQIYQPEHPQAMANSLKLLKEIGEKVDLYRFRSTPTEEAVRLAYETARPGAEHDL